MEDEKIIDLYWERKDEAIMETQAAYGRQLQTIAQRIVQSYEDAEESVNDTYLAAWRTIPPKRPKYFFAYLAKICRNFAFGKLDWLDAARRKAEVVTLSEEMELCIPDTSRDSAAEGREITRGAERVPRHADPGEPAAVRAAVLVRGHRGGDRPALQHE